MTAKTDLPPVPHALADVALVDGPTCAAAAGMGLSKWLDLVSKGEAPQPVIRRPRFSRYLMADLRAWLIEYTAQPHDPAAAHRAHRASAAAQAARRAS